MRIVLVDDQPLVRNGIASLLEAHGHVVVAEASDGQAGLEAVRKARPELVLMDLRMPVMDGLEATRLLKTEFPDLRIVILTVSDDERDLMEAVKSGAHGYLLKDLEADEFFEALDAVEHGESVMPARLARHLCRSSSGSRPRGPARRRTRAMRSPIASGRCCGWWRPATPTARWRNGSRLARTPSSSTCVAFSTSCIFETAPR